jgi:large subunit ribosomal protein L25
MESKTLSAVKRTRLGTASARRLRREGKIPAVVYGHTEPVGVAVDAHEFSSKFRTVSESTIIKLQIDGDSHDVLIRDFQRDVVSGGVVHVDFYEVEGGKLLRTNVSVHLTGTAVGVREGGLLESFVHEVEIECLPADLPEGLQVDVAELSIGHSVHVRDLALPSGVKVLNSPDQVICTVVHKRAEERPVAAAEVEEGAAPEPEQVEEPAEE